MGNREMGKWENRKWFCSAGFRGAAWFGYAHQPSLRIKIGIRQYWDQLPRPSGRGEQE